MKLTNITPLVLSLAAILASTACRTTHRHAKVEVNTAELEDSNSAAVAPEVQPDEIDDSIDQELQTSVNGEVAEIGTEEDEINKALKAGIPVEINKDVDRWIDFFANKNHDAFQRFIDRGQPYRKMIVATLRDSGVPSELYYLAMIESGFVLQAHSSASAVGFWQFIPASGRRYGLRVDRFVDERRDPWRATVAASLYLADLNNVFNSWYLAMAAYNAGENRIMSAIMRGKTRDFWELARLKVLPPETMDYIPKVLAAYIVGKNPEKYGFRVPKSESHEAFVGVTVPSPINLSAVADETEIPLESLQKFNPHLKSGVTPGDTSTYKIWIPKRFEDQFKDKADRLAEHRMAVKAESSRLAVGESRIRKFHRVKRGEHLNSIAQKYGVSVEQLKEINHLHSNTIFRGMKLKVMIDSTSEKVAASSKTHVEESSEESVYRVRRGDRLHGIAKKFGITVAELKRLNNLRRNGVKVGQILKVSRAG
ncbi:MAG: LysM peptidoglycan-binding domain-containing protein [Chitinophagaceae bacterium]|nr:LysM peptidoglycan-binding domain-containing protein [Oligoflexus sp.]